MMCGVCMVAGGEEEPPHYAIAFKSMYCNPFQDCWNRFRESIWHRGGGVRGRAALAAEFSSRVEEAGARSLARTLPCGIGLDKRSLA